MADKSKKLVVFFINLCEVLNSTHDQCGGLDVTRPMANRKVSPLQLSMHGVHAGANAPLLGTFKWLPLGLPFASEK